MKRLIFFALSALLAVSCLREFSPGYQSEELTFTLNSIEKTSLSGSGVEWVEGDELSVFDGMGNARFKATSSGASTTITGIADRAEEYTILYPYNSLASLEGKVLRTAIPHSQYLVRGGYDSAADVLVARACKGASVAMLHVCGLLQFTITSSNVSSIRVSSTDGTGLAGSISVTFDESGNPVISEASESSISAQPLNAASFEPGTYNICVAPCSLSSLKIDIRRTDGTIGTYTSPSPLKITRAVRTASSKAFDTLDYTFGDPVIGSIIRPDHPRIFFNSATLPIVRERANSVTLSNKEALLRTVDKLTEVPADEDQGDNAARAALAYLLTGNAKYLNLAKIYLKAAIDFYTAKTNARVAVDWFAFTRINALCAYDWIYNDLTPAERKALIVPLVNHVELVQSYSGLKIDGQPDGDKSEGYYGMASMLWFSGLAAHNDGIVDDLAQKHLVKGLGGYKELCRFRNDTSGDDGVLNTGAPNYSCGNYPYSHFNFFFSYESATGENLAACYPQMALFPQWIWWTWIRDADKPVRMRYAGVGDTYHGENIEEGAYIYLHLTNYIHFYKNVYPDAARLAASLRHRMGLNTIPKRMPYSPFLLDPEGEDDMEDDPRFASAPLKARYFETVGQVLMRSGWEKNSTYITVDLGNDVFNQHKHYDQNSFTIYRRDHLALDTGCRGNGEGSGARGDYNLVHYYSQSVAHNMVLIHKSGEPVPAHWGDRLPGRYNYGGTQSLAKTKVLAFETNDNFTYLASDATTLYNTSSSTKCSEAVRQFVHIQPDYLVVYDRVGATNASYAKEWLLHFQNKPVVNGKITRADTGYDSARLFCQTLLPEDAVLNLRGGEGNEFWAGENFPLEASVVESYAQKAKTNGRGPYTGAWRLEVKPKTASKNDRFLHVLNPCDDYRTSPVTATLVKTTDCDGVDLTIGGVSYRVLFNREGEVGGSITIGGVRKSFSNSVQPQSGILY